MLFAPCLNTNKLQKMLSLQILFHESEGFFALRLQKNVYFMRRVLFVPLN